jgi:hypothetical protein
VKRLTERAHDLGELKDRMAVQHRLLNLLMKFIIAQAAALTVFILRFLGHMG